ncbi:hypothetical protein B0H14DRAFT_2622336 [Mycena olivaceomarginata]|nr:hypothetical protein B0H14DRAFT_2622336 [Mycena olivaceomarginata]
MPKVDLFKLFNGKSTFKVLSQYEAEYSVNDWVVAYRLQYYNISSKCEDVDNYTHQIIPSEITRRASASVSPGFRIIARENSGTYLGSKLKSKSKTNVWSNLNGNRVKKKRGILYKANAKMESMKSCLRRYFQ